MKSILHYTEQNKRNVSTCPMDKCFIAGVFRACTGTVHSSILQLIIINALIHCNDIIQFSWPTKEEPILKVYFSLHVNA